MDTHRKLLHEHFTTYVGNTSLVEVLTLCTIPMPLLSIRHILASLFDLKLYNFVQNLLWDTVCVLVPTILLITIANRYVTLVWIIASAFVLFWKLFITRSTNKQPPLTFTSVICLHDMKCVLMLLTCLMLLNIDLPICPRRFAKTHTYGFSLMDTGTGWAVFLSAASAYQNILISSRAPQHLGSLLRRTVLPAIVIGSIRVCCVMLLNYQQPSDEYGLHWNFFYTFAFVRFISCTMLSTSLMTRRHSLHKRFLFLIGFTFFLFVLSSYIEQQIGRTISQQANWPSMEARASSLLVANAEGLLSLPGYTAVYFSGLLYFALSRLIFDNVYSTKNIGSFIAYTLFSLFLILSSYTYLDYFGWYSISRRFATPGYIVFIIMTTVSSVLFTSFLGFLHYLCGGSFDSPPSVLVQCTSKFGMAYFLLSNLATGAVNLFVDTLQFLPENAVVDPETGVYPVDPYSTVVQLLVLLIYTLLCLTLVFVFRTKSLTIR